MKLILLETIKKLGVSGQFVTVKPGYARNHLLAKNKAARLTKSNQSNLKTKKIAIERIRNEQTNIALKNSKNLDGKIITITRKADDDGKLYGSVSNNDIVNLLKSQFNICVSIQQINLYNKIKEIGNYNINITFYPQINAKIQLNIIKLFQNNTNIIKEII